MPGKARVRPVATVSASFVQVAEARACRLPETLTGVGIQCVFALQLLDFCIAEFIADPLCRAGAVRLGLGGWRARGGAALTFTDELAFGASGPFAGHERGAEH